MIKYEIIKELQSMKERTAHEDMSAKELKEKYSVPKNAKFTIISSPGGGWTPPKKDLVSIATIPEEEVASPFEIATYFDGNGTFGGNYKALLMIAYEVD